jgi:hypothetical protein
LPPVHIRRGKAHISALNGYVDTLKSFPGGARSFFEVAPSMIVNRSLQVAIPSMEVSTEQYMAMYSAYMYGQARGVDVFYTVVK